MGKVAECVGKLLDLSEALKQGDIAALENLAREISHLEHEADLIKNDIRNHLPKSLFLPIDRESLLEILSLQDSIADAAEDLAVLFTLYPLELPEAFAVEFLHFLKRNVETVRGVHTIVQELDELLETSFGGIEAEKVRRMVKEVAQQEHEVDLLQRGLLKRMFQLSAAIPPPAFILWMKIFEETACLSNLAEMLGNRIRMTLELK